MRGARTRAPREVAALVLAAAAAWAAVFGVVHLPGMSMGSTMGLSPIAFLGAWALMMAAMMLPGVAPVASLYAGTFGERRARRLILFAAGYLLLWTLLGVPAFALAAGADALAMAAPQATRWGVVAVLAAVAAYQLTPLKEVCLDHCRSPLSLFLDYASYGGRGRDLRVGIAHGVYCAGCCWPLMLLLVAVGTMNIGAMLALTAVVVAEKLLPRGDLVARAVAVAALATAVVFAALPAAFVGVVGG